MDNFVPDLQGTTTDSEVIQMLKRIETKVESNTKLLRLLLSDTPDTSLDSINDNKLNAFDSKPDTATASDSIPDIDSGKLPNCN